MKGRKEYLFFSDEEGMDLSKLISVINHLASNHKSDAGHFLSKGFSTPFFFYKNHAYKNVEAQITPKIKNIVVILLLAISISFPASDEI